MRVTVLGCGDAFGSDGRLQTCLHVETREATSLIDCGATAMIGLARAGLDPNTVGSILLSHLHGDHFAGLVWFLLHAQHVSKRRVPLTIVGPRGSEARYVAAAEALFPRSSQAERAYKLRFVELSEREALTLGAVTVTPFEVEHFSGAPPYALRLEADGKVLAFSGDTQWTDALIAAGQGADLFVCECYQWDRSVRFHLDYKTIAANLDRIAASRVLLTHMSETMLAHRHEVDDPRILLAEDGLVLDI